MKPGIYQMSEDKYHSDPCPAPSLSASIAGIIWHRSPLHGFMAHPRLNPSREQRESLEFDLGKAAHAVILEGDESRIAVIDADDWRTKAAKESRDEARASGKIPMLARQHADVMRMAAVAKSTIKESEIAGILDEGKPEQSVFARDGDTWLRGRMDFLTNDMKIILDYKTVSRSAAPESFLRSSVFQFGYDIQAAMYLRLLAVLGCKVDTKFLWLVQEIEPPYACSIIGASPSIIEVGSRKIEHVIRKWEECMASGIWPAYGSRISWIEAPAWEIGKIDERELLMEIEE